MELLEEIAKLEHEQWVEWSKALVKSEKLSRKRVERWKKLWIPYEELSEEEKEQDRFYARKVLNLIDRKKWENKTRKLIHKNKKLLGKLTDK